MKVIYLRWFPVQGFAVNSRLVIIVANRRHDAALHEHEYVHCRQMKSYGGALAWWFTYLTSRDFRLEVEVEAYRMQLAMRPDLLDAFARRLASSYWLGITADDARQMLLNTTH